MEVPMKLPLLVVEDNVLLPGLQTKISISSGKNFELIKSRLLSAQGSSIVGVMPMPIGQPLTSDPNSPTNIGIAATVDQVTANGWPQPTFSLSLTGIRRVRIDRLIMEDPYPIGYLDTSIYAKEDIDENDPKDVAMVAFFRETLMRLLELASEIGSIFILKLKKSLASYPTKLLPDVSTSLIIATAAEKLQIMAALDIRKRYQLVLPLLLRQIQALEFFQKNSQSATHFLTRVPLRGAITGPTTTTTFFPKPTGHMPPLGNMGNMGSDKEDSLQELYNRLKEAKMPAATEAIAMKDFQRLRRMASSSPEMNSLRNCLELMADLPWAKSSKETLDINKARADLEADHHAMDALKKRVIEYLAVRQLKNSLRGPILCFVGPPGVGKTSIGRSIAHSLGREFHRISLGGICNQSDIRGHRRTYIASMPGRIIQGLKTVGVNNPVFLLDEIDKLHSGANGDPAAALLEVLDPEQNHTFHDHFLNVPFDLSQVMFVATANTASSIPNALRDRMEVIQVDGYTHEEKLHIATKHLIPKQLSQHGLEQEAVEFTNDAILELISGYTHEAGVRNLERKICALCRAIAVQVAEKGAQHEAYVVDNLRLEQTLGPPLFSGDELWTRLGQPGVALGLAATTAGGTVLVVEASKMDGEGQLTLTGHLGSVMKESATLALAWLRTAACKYGLSVSSDLLSHTDVHIHFPAGAVSKDGPSAGIAISAVLLSLFSERPLSVGVAMTGEISLKGAVLPVGGITSKVLAAHRFGIRRVILPEQNAKDLLKLPEEVRDDMTFILASHIDEVIQAAFDGGFPTVDNSADTDSSILSKL